jgi:eukaryotic-like serine/threonine-protein kinase
MPGVHEVELRIAIAEGILSRENAEALGEEARRRRRSPLSLLVERGQLSEDTFASLLAQALGDAAPLGGELDEPPGAEASPPDARAPEAPAFPVPGWDRYANLGLLGQGGMGKVFLARDPRLRREVAIKFLHGDNPEQVRRLIAEARAQARVSHERVCKVHEVGEVEGKVYIAMQYIDGKPLGALAGELTVEQIVMLLRGAAEGIHEAHCAGIIHRDVKPSNIMVERGADGALRPYVMDFGLARSVQDDGVTLSGAVLGTPRYMAPEQASGQGKLDRRADVYSLGATLYHLLTGQPPIPGATPFEVMQHLATTEPRAPRTLDPDIPIDVEAIVLKCLEKDRSARYDSARALADDLGRFLSGEPVLARSAGAWYRMRKRLARHKRAVVATAAALVVLAGVVGWSIQTRLEASQRERIARRFTEQVERIDAMARYSALSPPHDVRSDRAAIRTQMVELESEIRAAGAVAAGPGHYALGRAYLALDDNQTAREQLERAWQHGFREPRVAYALAVVMGQLYRQHLLGAERFEQKDLRDARKREVERQYRDPALAYLAASGGAEVSSTAYLAALSAYYAGQLDEALRHLDANAAGVPWWYEAAKLRGDVLLERALRLRDQGNTDRARLDFEAGRRAYAAAGAIAESVPAVYESLGELEYANLVMELYGQGDVVAAFDRVIAATSRALAIMPDHAAALVLEARAYRSLAEHQANQGGDIEPLLAKAIAAAQRALAIDPTLARARFELSRIYRQSGEARAGHNQDPGEQLRTAIELADGIAPAERDVSYHENLGLIFSIWADHEGQNGRDAQANWSKSITAYDRALQINDKVNSVWINQGINYFMRASQPGGEDPDGDLTRAARALETAMSINPKNVAPYFYEGMVYKLRAERARARGGDPGPDLARSLRAHQGGLGISPKLPHLHNGAGLVYVDRAKDAWVRGADPEPLLEQARAAFAQAIAVAPDHGHGYNNLGDMLSVRAWLQRARGDDPSASIRAAVTALKQAIERIPDQPTFWVNLGAAHTILAGYDVEHGRDPQASLAAASSAIRTALENNPRDALAQHTLGESLGLLARFRARRGQSATRDFEGAVHAFETAIELAPEVPDHRLAFGELCYSWAVVLRETGSDPGPLLQRGTELVDPVLATHPTWPDARVVRANLLVAQAQSAASTARRRELAVRAADDFARALAVNPALERAWKGRAALARRLATTAR